MENVQLNENNRILFRQEEKNENHHEEISLTDIFRVIYNAKWFIALVVIIAVMGVFLYMKFLSPETGYIQTIISYNYSGIEKGLDPHGINIDVSMIKSPVVLAEVVKALELEQYGITSNDLRININISPIIPGNITENIKRLEEDIKGNINALQEFVYYPNKYIITFKLSRRLKISEQLGQQIVDEVVKQYQQYFYRTYSDMSVLANAIEPMDYSEYDYPEISTVIHNQINIFENYLKTKLEQENGSNFRSVETGLSFVDIMESISIIKNVDLSRLDSIIGAYNLTKNKEKLIRLYEYQIKMAELNMSQKEDEEELLLATIQKYQKDQNLILQGLAGGDGSGVLNFESTNEYYNTLTQKYIDAGISARESSRMILYYQQEIEKLLNDSVAPSTKIEAEADVNRLIGLIRERIEHWIELTNKTVSEYYNINLFNKAITRNSPPEYYSNIGGSLMVFAITAALAFMLSVCLVFIRYYIKTYVIYQKTKLQLT